MKQTKEHWLKSVYGLTSKQYDELYENQQGRCAICKKEQPLCIDHCHLTKKVRGLLCSNCNRGLGMFKDEIARLGSAMFYLSENQTYV